MPTQIAAAGFDDLRAYMENNWDHVALINDIGTELIRIDIPNTSGASFTSGSASNPLTADITVSGQDIIDAGNSLPVTVSETEVYKTQAATTTMGSDTMVDAVIEVANDELNVIHDYRIPK